jgi:hypothetical protein
MTSKMPECDWSFGPDMEDDFSFLLRPPIFEGHSWRRGSSNRTVGYPPSCVV